jgi:hypothetical protein
MVAQFASPAVHTLSPQVHQTQARIQSALERAISIPRLSSIDEQRFSATFIGLVDLQQRLAKTAELATQLDLPVLHDALNDLVGRAWRAAAILDAMSALYTLDATGPDALVEAADCSRHLAALQKGAQHLFA